jgi:hypothetical protein
VLIKSSLSFSGAFSPNAFRSICRNSPQSWVDRFKANVGRPLVRKMTAFRCSSLISLKLELRCTIMIDDHTAGWDVQTLITLSIQPSRFLNKNPQWFSCVLWPNLHRFIDFPYTLDTVFTILPCPTRAENDLCHLQFISKFPYLSLLKIIWLFH